MLWEFHFLCFLPQAERQAAVSASHFSLVEPREQIIPSSILLVKRSSLVGRIATALTVHLCAVTYNVGSERASV